MSDTHELEKKISPLVPAEVDFMPPLLRCLSSLIRLKGKHVSPQFLMAGLAGAEMVSVGDSALNFVYLCSKK